MLKSYSRGYDMPPRLRNALIGNEEAAKNFITLLMVTNQLSQL